MRCFVFLMGFVSGIVRSVAGRATTMRGKSLLVYLARDAGAVDVRPARDTLLPAMKKAWFARFAGGRGKKHEAVDAHNHSLLR